MSIRVSDAKQALAYALNAAPAGYHWLRSLVPATLSSFIADRAWCSASFARPSVVSTCANRQCGCIAAAIEGAPLYAAMFPQAQGRRWQQGHTALMLTCVAARLQQTSGWARSSSTASRNLKRRRQLHKGFH